MDRARRRPFWVTTSAAMFVCLIVAGLVFHLNVTGPIAFPMIEAVLKRLIGSAAGVFWFYAVICLIAFF